MELQGIIIFAAVWLIVGLLSKAGKKDQRPPSIPRQRPPRAPPLPLGMDPTQQEGSRLELVLRQVQRALEEAGKQPDLPGPSRPRYEDLEEGRSLEVDPEVISLEGPVSRPVRRRVDQDDEVEQIVAGRLKATAARDAASSPVDHNAFDERIRQQPADHTAARSYTPKQLRDAMIWREILGPPVTLRRETELDSSS
jgi:hypothetical protein